MKITDGMFCEIAKWLIKPNGDKCPFGKKSINCDDICSEIFEDLGKERNSPGTIGFCPCTVFGFSKTQERAIKLLEENR